MQQKIIHNAMDINSQDYVNMADWWLNKVLAYIKIISP